MTERIKGNPKTEGGLAARGLRSPYAAFICLWLVMTVCHMMFRLGTGDDTFYSQILHNNGLIEQLVTFYHTWSARTLVDVGLIVINYLPGMVWRLANPVMIVLCAWGMAGILDVRRNAGMCWFICGAMLFYPWQVMSSAGWVTTTTAFLWPAAAALMALVPTARVMRGEGVPVWQCVVSVLAVFYAVFMEQVAAAVFALLLGWIGYTLATRKKVHWLAVAQLAATLVAIVWILTSPGMESRFGNESASWFPTFAMKSPVSKLELGLSLAITNLFCTRNWIFLFFCLLLVWLVWKHHKNLLYRAVPLVPLAMCLALGIFKDQMLSVLPQLQSFTDALQAEGIITFANCNTLSAYLPLVVLYAGFGLCVVSLYLGLGHSAASLKAIYVLAVGMGTHVMLGFSPTAQVSGPRTGFFFMMVLIALSGYLFSQLREEKGWFRWVFLLLFVCVCAVQIYSLQEMRIATGY